MPIQRVNDINIYYETHGEGEPLVLITGLASDVSDWAGIIAVALALGRPYLVSGLILVSTFVRPAPRTLWRFLVLTVMARLSPFRGSRKYPQPYYAFQRQREASGSFNATDRLHEIQVPTLIPHGRSDKSAPLRLAEEMHAGIHDSQMVTFPGGHIFFIFRSQPFIAAIRDFLAAVDRD